MQQRMKKKSAIKESALVWNAHSSSAVQHQWQEMHNVQSTALGQGQGQNQGQGQGQGLNVRWHTKNDK